MSSVENFERFLKQDSFDFAEIFFFANSTSIVLNNNFHREGFSEFYSKWRKRKQQTVLVEIFK